MAGRPCIRGMRINVSLVANLAENGMSDDEILASIYASALANKPEASSDSANG
jgi:hypothetical protein